MEISEIRIVAQPIAKASAGRYFINFLSNQQVCQILVPHHKHIAPTLSGWANVLPEVQHYLR
jgi:hypothetical protein